MLQRFDQFSYSKSFFCERDMGGVPVEIAAVPGLLVVRKCLTNIKGLAWLHSLLEKAKWTSSRRKEPPDSAQLEIVSPKETASVVFADLSTIEPEVFAQLLSAAAFHLPEDSELLRCIRLGNITQPLQFHPSHARFVSAVLILGRGSTPITLNHRHHSGIFSHPLVLSTGDLVIRRGKVTAEWDMNVAAQAPAVPHPQNAVHSSDAVSLTTCPQSATAHSDRHLALFSCKGEWPDQERQYYEQP